MSLLAQIKTSGARMGARIVIAGSEKMGKTTFATGAPNALLIPTEQGYGGVNVQHVPLITEWTQMTALMQEVSAALGKGGFPVQTIVLDSTTALEALIHKHVIALDSASKNNKSISMESAHGGYGKAYGIALNFFREFLAWCDWLAINHAINVVLTCHVFSSKVRDPLHGEYDSWDLLLHSPKDQKNYGKRETLTQWADVVGYLHEPLIVTSINNVNQGITKGQGRVLAVERTPAYVAGNRYGMRGTIALPAPPANSWNAFAENLYKATEGRADVYNRAKV